MEKTPEVLERRKHIRVSLNAYVTTTLVLGKAPQEKLLISKDIAPEGIFLFTSEAFPMGTLFKLKIQTPTTTKQIRVEAKVVRIIKDADSRVTGVGLFFTRISDADKKELFKHLYLAYHYVK